MHSYIGAAVVYTHAVLLPGLHPPFASFSLRLSEIEISKNVPSGTIIKRRAFNLKMECVGPKVYVIGRIELWIDMASLARKIRWLQSAIEEN